MRHCSGAVPKNLDDNKPKMFYTRVVYNSKFRSVNKNEANIKIRKNTQQIGTNKCEKGLAIGKVCKVQKAHKQKCNMVQGVCYMYLSLIDLTVLTLRTIYTLIHVTICLIMCVSMCQNKHK